MKVLQKHLMILEIMGDIDQNRLIAKLKHKPPSTFSENEELIKMKK